MRVEARHHRFCWGVAHVLVTDTIPLKVLKTNQKKPPPPSIIFHPRTRFSSPHKQHKPSLPPTHLPPISPRHSTPAATPPHSPQRLPAALPDLPSSLSGKQRCCPTGSPADTHNAKTTHIPFPSYLYPLPHRQRLQTPPATQSTSAAAPRNTRLVYRPYRIPHGMYRRPGHLLDVLRIA